MYTCILSPSYQSLVRQRREGSVAGESVQWRVGVSYIEIYREELRDLLDCGMGSQSLAIRDNEQGHTGEWGN